MSTHLEQLRAKKAAREAERAVDSERAEIEFLELENLLEEKHGARGKFFEMYDGRDLGEGIFAVYLGAAVTYKTYLNSKMEDEDRSDFVRNNLAHPSAEHYLAARGRRPGLDLTLSNMLMRLFGFDLKAQQVK